MESVIKEVGKQVKYFRSRKGWSQEDLGTRTGLSQGSISQIESGRRKNLTLEQVDRIAEALDVEIGDLCASFRRNVEPTITLIGVLPALRDTLIKLASKREEQQQEIGQILERVMGLLESI